MWKPKIGYILLFEFCMVLKVYFLLTLNGKKNRRKHEIPSSGTHFKNKKKHGVFSIKNFFQSVFWKLLLEPL